MGSGRWRYLECPLRRGSRPALWKTSGSTPLPVPLASSRLGHCLNLCTLLPVREPLCSEPSPRSSHPACRVLHVSVTHPICFQSSHHASAPSISRVHLHDPHDHCVSADVPRPTLYFSLHSVSHETGGWGVWGEGLEILTRHPREPSPV